MLLAGLTGGRPADGAMKITSWQMTEDLTLVPSVRGTQERSFLTLYNLLVP